MRKVNGFDLVVAGGTIGITPEGDDDRFVKFCSLDRLTNRIDADIRNKLT